MVFFFKLDDILLQHFYTLILERTYFLNAWYWRSAQSGIQFDVLVVVRAERTSKDRRKRVGRRKVSIFPRGFSIVPRGRRKVCPVELIEIRGVYNSEKSIRRREKLFEQFFFWRSWSDEVLMLCRRAEHVGIYYSTHVRPDLSRPHSSLCFDNNNCPLW